MHRQLLILCHLEQQHVLMHSLPCMKTRKAVLQGFSLQQYYIVSHISNARGVCASWQTAGTIPCATHDILLHPHKQAVNSASSLQTMILVTKGCSFSQPIAAHSTRQTIKSDVIPFVLNRRPHRQSAVPPIEVQHQQPLD